MDPDVHRDDVPLLDSDSYLPRIEQYRGLLYSESMPSAYLALVFTSAIWGIAAIVIKYTLNYLPPFTFLTYRFFISFLVILPFFIAHLHRHRYSLKQFWEISILNFIGIPFNLALVFIGINFTSALEASLILSIEPILTVLGGYFFLKEHINRREILGLIIAVVGTFIVVVEPLLSNGHQFVLRNFIGNLILLFSNFSLSYYTLRSKVDLHHKYSPWFITMQGFILAPFVILPFILLEQRMTINDLMTKLPLSAHLGVWFMAVFSGIIAYFLYQYGLKRIQASEATIFHYLTNVFGIPLAIFWLHEKISLPYLIGALTILIGVIIAEYQPHRKKHQLILAYIQRLVANFRRF